MSRAKAPFVTRTRSWECSTPWLLAQLAVAALAVGLLLAANPLRLVGGPPRSAREWVMVCVALLPVFATAIWIAALLFVFSQRLTLAGCREAERIPDPARRRELLSAALRTARARRLGALEVGLRIGVFAMWFWATLLLMRWELTLGWI